MVSQIGSCSHERRMLTQGLADVRYNKDKKTEEDARAAEIRQIKQAEEDALHEAL